MKYLIGALLFISLTLNYWYWHNEKQYAILIKNIRNDDNKSLLIFKSFGDPHFESWSNKKDSEYFAVGYDSTNNFYFKNEFTIAKDSDQEIKVERYYSQK